MKFCPFKFHAILMIPAKDMTFWPNGFSLLFPSSQNNHQFSFQRTCFAQQCPGAHPREVNRNILLDLREKLMRGVHMKKPSCIPHDPWQAIIAMHGKKREVYFFGQKNPDD